MGCKHSTPAPTEQDFLVRHKPSPSGNLCKGFQAKSTAYEFQVQRDSWNNESPVQLGRMTLAPPVVDTSSTYITRCVLFQDIEPILVLNVNKYGSPHVRIQICSFEASKTKQESCGDHQGRPWYEWAVVVIRRESRQYDLKMTEDDIAYTTEYCGSYCGPRKFAVKRQGVVCASLENPTLENPHWQCRVGPGIDPATIVCFAACIDKLRESEGKRFETGYKAAAANPMNYKDMFK